jgi:cob(I)alamin adenosyltransferase
MLIDNKENITKPRITTGYKEGKGDKGISKTCSYCTLPKYSSNAVLNVYMELDQLRALIGELLNPSLLDRLIGNRIRDKKLICLLQWLINDSYSMGALIALGGNSKRHEFNQETLLKIEGYIQLNKEATGDCKDFLIHKGYIAKLDSVRVSIRRLEAFFNQAQVDMACSAELELCTSIINRLSSAIFWGIRKEYKLAGKKESYWTGNRTELVL